jgi:hypothetical protein
MFGWSRRERADREIKEIITWVLGQSVVQGSNFPPVGVCPPGAASCDSVFATRLQMNIALEACGFFLHAVDRLAYRPGDERLREAVYDTTARQMVRTFSDMIFNAWGASSSLSEIEQDNLDLFNTRQLEYGKATRLIGETFNDLKSASWLAAHNIARAAEIAEPNIRVMALHTALLNSLVAMDLANRIKKVEGFIK